MSREIEERVAALAARQHGVVTRPQLLGTGLTVRMVEHRLRTGRLHRVHRGVYRVGPLTTGRSREMAAVLACRGGARLSHRSAGWLWQVTPRPPESAPVEVKVPGRQVVRRPGIRPYRALALEVEQVTIVDNVPVTPPDRTLLDLARVLGARDLERAVARTERSRLVTLEQLADVAARHRGRPGVATLAALLEAERGPALTRSPFEDRFADEVGRFGLPEPELNVRVAGHELDCYWATARLAVELDGRAYHASWQSQRNDRRRDSDLSALGIDVIRITWQDLEREPDRTMMRVGQALAVRSAR